MARKIISDCTFYFGVDRRMNADALRRRGDKVVEYKQYYASLGQQQQ